MSTSVKKEIRKIVKMSGSNSGLVKRVIESKFSQINFDDYAKFTKECFDKKYASTESSLRASVRFQ